MPQIIARCARTFVLGLCFVVVVSCSKATQGSMQAGIGEGRTQPGVLRIALPQDLKTLDPMLDSSVAEGLVDRMLFEPLLSADSHGKLVPMLAIAVPTLRNGGISADGRTIVYHLRKNARWSDGVAVTSADVRFSWQAIMNPANDVVSRHGYDVIGSIDTPDATTVVVHLKGPFAPFVNTFFAESDQPYEIVPAHVLARYPDINQIAFNSNPTVTDGPFRFVEWVHGDHLTLAANPDFFMGAPHLARIRVEIIPDEHTAVQLLRQHAIDYMFQASINTYRELASIPGVRIVWNDMNGYQGIELNLTRPPLRDARVRAAIASAIDKDRLVQTLAYGQVKAATEDLPDWMWAFDPAARPPSYDVARARRLLGEAGYEFARDGMASKDGAPLRLELVTDVADATHRKICELVQAMLRQAGIDTSLKFYPADLLYAPAGLGGILHRGEFDLVMIPWYAGLDPDDSSQFLCANVPPNGYDDTHYCTREMDDAQNIALTRYDLPSRRRAYATIERLLARDNPAIFLWWQRQQEAISADFKGFAPNPVEESWNAWQWSI